jgi:hypothetical protein
VYQYRHRFKLPEAARSRIRLAVFLRPPTEQNRFQGHTYHHRRRNNNNRVLSFAANKASIKNEHPGAENKLHRARNHKIRQKATFTAKTP